MYVCRYVTRKKCIIKHGTRAEAPAAAAVRRRVARGAIFIYASANRRKKTIIRLKTHTQTTTDRASDDFDRRP